ncbi:hypothetical protein CYLTODRAFT_423799 [Cylindrobasidium torrendii FP15055 ss-10]|uniref:Uncharacterized protein n=1 Tax=Cylindrobasidium torrendii FP15055 ss-10 TaxID=1314674 RepID=A0A0D7B687_9AGAR|nr:hypothetical protein CYLTODRAFT_423799 [Cylindrobasidium torrendii FP15055 ss-10]
MIMMNKKDQAAPLLDSAPQPKRRSFMFGLFSSSAAKPPRAPLGNKLTKATSPPPPRPQINSSAQAGLPDPFSADVTTNPYNRQSPSMTVTSRDRRQPGDPREMRWPTPPPARGPAVTEIRPPQPPTSQTSTSSWPSPSVQRIEDERGMVRQDSIPALETQPLYVANPDPDQPPPYEDIRTKPVEKGEKKAESKHKVENAPEFEDGRFAATSSQATSSQEISSSSNNEKRHVKDNSDYVNGPKDVFHGYAHHKQRSQPIVLGPPSTLPPLPTDPPASGESGPTLLDYSADQGAPYRPHVHSANPQSFHPVREQHSGQPPRATGAHSPSHRIEHEHNVSPSNGTDRQKQRKRRDPLAAMDPFGTNDSPYAAIPKMVKNDDGLHHEHPHHNRRDPSMHIVNVEATHVPFGGSLNLAPGQILPRNFRPYAPSPQPQAGPSNEHWMMRQRSSPGDRIASPHQYAPGTSQSRTPQPPAVLIPGALRQFSQSPPGVMPQRSATVSPGHRSPAELPSQVGRGPVPSGMSMFLQPSGSRAQPQHGQLSHRSPGDTQAAVNAAASYNNTLAPANASPHKPSPSDGQSDPYYVENSDDDAYGGIVDERVVSKQRHHSSAPLLGMSIPAGRSAPNIHHPPPNSMPVPNQQRPPTAASSHLPPQMRQASGHPPDFPEPQYSRAGTQFSNGYAESAYTNSGAPPPPRHVPKHLVMPTPLQTPPRSQTYGPVPTPSQRVDPRHQPQGPASRPFNQSTARQGPPPLPSAMMKMYQANTADMGPRGLQKSSSMSQVHSSRSADVVAPKANQGARKPTKLSKKKTFF